MGAWNTHRPRGKPSDLAGEDPGSLSPGPNLNRRSFVEIAVASVAGATLVGAGAAAAETDALGGIRACDGQYIAPDQYGGVGVAVEYGDLTAIHETTHALPHDHEGGQ